MNEAIGRRVSPGEAAEAIAKGLSAVFEIDAATSPVPADVIEAARRLEPRYHSDEWNLRREKQTSGDNYDTATKGGCKNE